MSSNSFIHHTINLPACSWSANDFYCSDIVFFSQSKSTIIGLHSLQKSLLSLENVGNNKKKVRERSVSVLDSYLHFQFCGVKNLPAQTNFSEAIVLVQLKV